MPDQVTCDILSAVWDVSQLIFLGGPCYSETRGGYQVGHLGTNLPF